MPKVVVMVGPSGPFQTIKQYMAEVSEPLSAEIFMGDYQVGVFA